jgi:hypothetical protein
MNSKNSFKVNKRFYNLVLAISIFGILSIGSIATNFLNGNNVINTVFAQSANTSSSNTTNNTTSSNQQQPSQTTTTTTNSPANFSRALGSIASVQNNATGKPTWILSGQWDLAIPHPLKINKTNPPDAAVFNAGFEMIKTDGTSMHTHTISDFTLKSSAVNKNDLILSGTATVSMKNGPVKDVPISITILNQGAMYLLIDPVKTSNHFGSTPIYGTVSSVGIFLSFP